MKKNNQKNYWRKLDNVSKLFSLESKNNKNIFRFSIVLTSNINKSILKKALNKALKKFPSFKVKIGSGIFWNYLEFNPKSPIIEQENDIPCNKIDDKNNNDYLFKVTYYKNKINLDVFHVLTDGNGAIKFLKEITYDYLNIKYNLKEIKTKDTKISYKDEYIKNYDKSFKIKEKFKKVYQISEKYNKNINNTSHYTIDVNDIKTICKNYNVTITEYLTATYIYAIYKSFYKKKSKKEISIHVPIDLRKHYKVDTLSNFFVCANINPKIIKNKITKFEEILSRVHQEFENKINPYKIKSYLSRDVKLGKNIGLRLVPLIVKKPAMKLIMHVANKISTSTVSNVGIIDIEKKYKKYIDNVLVLIKPQKNEKIKCTICSYEDKLNITINSNIKSNILEQTFFELLKNGIDNIKLESNTSIKLLN